MQRRNLAIIIGVVVLIILILVFVLLAVPKYKDWGTWSDCTKICGKGSREHTREGGGWLCKEDKKKASEECNLRDCTPIDYYKKYAGKSMEGYDDATHEHKTLGECAKLSYTGVNNVPYSAFEFVRDGDPNPNNLGWCSLSKSNKNTIPAGKFQDYAPADYYHYTPI